MAALLSSLMENKLEMESGPTIEKIVQEASKGNTQVVLEYMRAHPHLVSNYLIKFI